MLYGSQHLRDTRLVEYISTHKPQFILLHHGPTLFQDFLREIFMQRNLKKQIERYKRKILLILALFLLSCAITFTYLLEPNPKTKLKEPLTCKCDTGIK